MIEMSILDLFYKDFVSLIFNENLTKFIKFHECQMSNDKSDFELTIQVILIGTI